MKNINSYLLGRKKSFFSMVVVLILAPVLLLSGNAFAEGNSGSSHRSDSNEGVSEHGDGHGNYGDVSVTIGYLTPVACTLAGKDSNNNAVSSTCTTFTVSGAVVGVYGWGHPRGSVSLTVTGTTTTTPQDCGFVHAANARHEGDSHDNSSTFNCTFDVSSLAAGGYNVVANYTADANRSDDDDTHSYFSASSNSQTFTVNAGGAGSRTANQCPTGSSGTYPTCTWDPCNDPVIFSNVPGAQLPTNTCTNNVVAPSTTGGGGGGPAIANITATPVIPTIPGGTTGAATVTWTNLDSTGITGYTVTSDPDGFTCNADGAKATSCVVPGLSTNVHYVFKVVAHTASGNANLGTSNSIMINALLVVKVHNNLKLIVSNFASGSAQLTPYMKMQIATYASDLLKFGGKTASLVGYTDPSSTTSYNLTLGMKRAAAVQAYLVHEFNLLKMPWTPVVTCASKGKAAPRATNTSALGRALNRRVEVLATF
jgi:flagellar motor protein MotB